MPKHYLAHSAISGVSQVVINAVLVFIGIPIFIRLAGQTGYGIYALISVIGNVNIFLDFGFNQTLVKLLVEQGKCTKSDHDIIVSCILSMAIVLPFVVVCFLLQDWIIIKLLAIPSEYKEDAAALLKLVMVSNMLIFVGQQLKAVTDAMQKMYLGNYAQILYSICRWFFIIIGLLITKNLKSVGYAILGATLTWLVYICIATKNTWGIPKIANLHINFISSTKKQLKYSCKIYVGSLAAIMQEPLLKVMTSHLLDVNAVGVLEIALNFKRQLRSLFTKILHPLYPFIISINNITILKKIIIDIEITLISIIMPLCTLLVFIIPVLMNKWLHLDNNYVGISTTIIISSFLIGYITIMPMHQFLIGKGYPGLAVLYNSLNAIAMICSYILLIKPLSCYALPISYAIGYSVTLVTMSILQQIILHNSILTNYNKMLYILLCNAILGIVLYVCKKNLGDDLLMIAVLSIISVVITVILYRIFHVIDKALFKKILPNKIPFRNLILNIFVGAN